MFYKKTNIKKKNILIKKIKYRKVFQKFFQTLDVFINYFK